MLGPAPKTPMLHPAQGLPDDGSIETYPYGCFVYVLMALDASRTYVGWTTDVDARLLAHNAGKGAKSTRGRQWRVIHSEKFRNKSDAMRREWALKRDRAFRKKLVAEALA
jgi:putative endonuclease